MWARRTVERRELDLLLSARLHLLRKQPLLPELMVIVVLFARLALAAVFAVAGVAKASDRAGTRSALRAFGAPARLAGPLALLLPLAELAVAALLLPASTAATGAAGALVLLVIFCGAIAYNLAQGRAPDCRCFGQLHSAPASWKTLVRNGVLAAVAAYALVASLSGIQPGPLAWIGELDNARSVALALGFAVALGIGGGIAAVLALLRGYGRVLVRLERVERALAQAGLDVGELQESPQLGLAPGTPVPPVPELEPLLALGFPLLLLFTNPNCASCKSLLSKAARWQRDHGSTLTVALASEGTAEQVHREAAEFGLRHVIVDSGLHLYEAFHANGTPSAIVIAANRTIGSWVVSGADGIEALVVSALQERTLQPLPIGSQVPAIMLPSVADGGLVALPSGGGKETILLFWNPACGFCRAMHGDLLAWERRAPNGGPRLVVISSGDADSTRAEGFRSSTLLDEGFTAGAALGVGGTPMALLLDAQGRVGSVLVAGVDEVLAFVKRHA